MCIRDRTYILHEKIVESKHYKIGELGSFLIPTSNGYSNFGKEYNAVKLIHDLSDILKCPDDGQIVFQQLTSSHQAIDVYKRQQLMPYSIAFSWIFSSVF